MLIAPPAIVVLPLKVFAALFAMVSVPELLFTKLAPPAITPLPAKL